MRRNEWSEWLPFPDPTKSEYLTAPFGAGCYELRHRSNRQLILFGSGGNCAYRMSSLLPPPAGCGHRSNAAKRDYVFSNLADVEYHTLACTDAEEAEACEADLRRNKAAYIFKT